ncbi:transporter substrate-binding domain-containing protein [Bordetella avium]|uniref:transporter substrate-binding domain-containing protein n=1 Tax=Bordetella avium TaxID=521 RepID=UPI000E0A128A|nr:transporter substrate-binding domain-containing protein [Bordetella avium]RIQ12798.1 ABC transporter substrate-binding protein [Bordetella avium]RIQ37972.1 ABC transporter substrate-binding protein [Bordetella avium]RIQ41800.1 ABC transporter substrate-binding protein [Bordetella avium]RIQ43524.1 ABC transporter substrate-binding protein [Bordetella avium]RIQ48701.1 ABC transporter substrate-binding protein [Bordetella avium]
MRRLITGLLLCLAAAPWAAQADVAFSQARARGELRVGIPAQTADLPAGAKVRTPERLDMPVAAKLAERLGLPLVLVVVPAEQASEALAQGRADVVLADRVDTAPMGPYWVGSGYSGQPKAVIRNDTPLRQWSEVAGKRVCMAQSNNRAEALARRYGATVQTYAAPSDALVGVREGRCDIGLIDDSVWAPLMRLPEWRKFAFSLPAEGGRAELGWLAAPAEADWLRLEMRAWRATGFWTALANKWARDLAFDVYLDQEVADCHG